GSAVIAAVHQLRLPRAARFWHATGSRSERCAAPVTPRTGSSGSNTDSNLIATLASMPRSLFRAAMVLRHWTPCLSLRTFHQPTDTGRGKDGEDRAGGGSRSPWPGGPGGAGLMVGDFPEDAGVGAAAHRGARRPRSGSWPGC